MSKIHISIKSGKPAAGKIVVQSFSGNFSGKFAKAHKLAQKQLGAIHNCDSIALRAK